MSRAAEHVAGAGGGPGESDLLAIPRVRGALRGSIRVPGSKSLTNRHVMLAALAGGGTTLRGALRADDCDRLLQGVSVLGAEIHHVERADHGDVIAVTGVGGRFPRGGRVDLGDGGTPARFMLAAGARAAAPVTVDGSERLRERPMAEGLAMLRALGAEVRCEGRPDHLPVTIAAPPGGVSGGRVEVGAARSSQFASALMLIAPWLDDGIELHMTPPVTSAAYLSLSASALRAWGYDVDIDLEGDAPYITVAGRQGAAAAGRGPQRVIDIEPDASSAVYWMVAAAALPGSAITFPGLSAESLQPDIAILDVLQRAGAQVRRAHAAHALEVKAGASLRGFSVDASDWPDGALAAAALAACAAGPSTITGLHTLAHKESDRLAALRAELAKVGVRAETTADAIAIDPSGMHAQPATIDTWNDHRIAMTFAVIGLVRGGVDIRDPGCVRKSYPGFWHDLQSLVRDAAPPRRGAGAAEQGGLEG